MADVPAVLNSELARTTWDAVVIGAGPAGALAARQAARAGLNVLLVDAKDFPREKVCGGYLSQRALNVLRQTRLIGAVSDRPEAHVSRLELVCGRQRLHLPLPSSRVIERASFDAGLVQAAKAAGATVLTKTQGTVETATTEPFRRVTLARNGSRETVRARIVICADGLSRTSARHLPEFAISTATDSRVGIGAVVQDNLDASRSGQITMVVSRQGYVGISPINGHRINVAAAVDPRQLSGAAPADVVAGMLEHSAVAVPPGLASASWRGTLPLTSRPRRVAAQRVLLIGDAAGYVEPFTGEGMAAALESAVAVAPFAVQASQAWDASIAARWERLHRQIVRDRQLTCRQLAWILRRPWVAFTAFSMCRLLPGVARRVIAKTSYPSIHYLSSGSSIS